MIWRIAISSVGDPELGVGDSMTDIDERVDSEPPNGVDEGAAVPRGGDGSVAPGDDKSADTVKEILTSRGNLVRESLYALASSL